MRKIPTLFERVYDNHRKVDILPNVTAGMEWVMQGEGIATEKYDGSCCAIIDGEYYKRYDAKQGKTPPFGAIPCCKPDPITGHWPHWIKVDRNNKSDIWHIAAYDHSYGETLEDGTYEVIGPHFRNNPYELNEDILVRHGEKVLRDVPRSFEGIREYLREHNIEGIVFWKDGIPQCKIKRSDFGFAWNNETMRK